MNKDIKEKIFFITGGGTGGHIYPAIAVINELKDNFNIKCENIFYIGNKKNLEYNIVTNNGIQFLSTNVIGMPRKISFKLVLCLYNLFTSIIKAIYYVLKYKPDVIFATGGYVCAPILFAAKIFKVPYVLHDSDCSPGIVTRSFANKAEGINLAFDNAKKYIKNDNLYFYNNPVRNAFFNKTKEEARSILNIKDEFLILVMGGSQGAKSINKASKKLIETFKDKKDIKIIVQTGKKNYEEYVKGLNIPDNTKIEPYFEDMSIPILASDLIVSRAGSISISEILSSKNPSILIPYPYAAGDHQRINARAIVEKNAAEYLEDSEAEEKLTKIVSEIMENKEKYNELKRNAEILGENYKHSTRKITELVLSSLKE